MSFGHLPVATALLIAAIYPLRAEESLVTYNH
jgi:hypothetical protein